MRAIRSLSWAVLVAAALVAAPRAQIKSFTLEEMVQTADGAVYGQITHSRVGRVLNTDGSDLYFTTLTIEGRALTSGRPITIDVVHAGGFLDPADGAFNSEAPAADDTAIGRTVVAFYAWSDDLGGGLGANVLVAAHGGLYRTVEGPRGAAVLGRGQGYAIGANLRVSQLESAVQHLVAAKPVKR